LTTDRAKRAGRGFQVVSTGILGAKIQVKCYTDSFDIVVVWEFYFEFDSSRLHTFYYSILVCTKLIHHGTPVSILASFGPTVLHCPVAFTGIKILIFWAFLKLAEVHIYRCLYQ